jgi:hypothetical protein
MMHSRDTEVEMPCAFIRGQRKLANLSLRKLAETTRLSNPPYLSQMRGLPAPPTPGPATLSPASPRSRSSASPVLGGLINEYERAA